MEGGELMKRETLLEFEAEVVDEILNDLNLSYKSDSANVVKMAVFAARRIVEKYEIAKSSSLEQEEVD